MSGDQFEGFLQVLFERLGYEAEITGRYDKGADLILTREGVRTVVQAKCWKQPVGVEAVRAIIAALRPYRCRRGMVVTNSAFTRSARQAAEENNIELWDRTDLANMLLAAKNPGRPLPIPSAIAWLFNEPRQTTISEAPGLPHESTYVCATCGRQVTNSTLAIPHRVAQHGAWGNKCQQELNDVGGAGRHRLIPVALAVTMCSRRYSAEVTPAPRSRKGQSRD
jgi:restriction system protein